MRRGMVLIFAVCILCTGGVVNGQENILAADFTYEDILNSTFMIRAGAWFQEMDGDVVIDESFANETEVNFDSDLGLDENDDFTLRAELQPWQKHHFRFGYNGIDFNGDETINRQLVIDGDTYQLNDRVVTDLEMNTYEIGYRYDLFRGETYSLAPMFQVNLVDFDVSINDINDPTISADEDIFVPLPMLGVRGEYFPHPRFGVFADVKGLTIGDTASVVDLEAGGQINVMKNFSIVGGYRYMYFDFEIDDSQGEMTIDGPFIAGQIQF